MLTIARMIYVSNSLLHGMNLTILVVDSLKTISVNEEYYQKILIIISFESQNHQ